MPKYIAKLSKFGGQYRVTLPKGLMDEVGWHDVEFVLLGKLTDGQIKMWRFVDEEGLGIKRKADRPGSDR